MYKIAQWNCIQRSCAQWNCIRTQTFIPVILAKKGYCGNKGLSLDWDRVKVRLIEKGLIEMVRITKIA